MEQIIMHQANGVLRPLNFRRTATAMSSAKQTREINGVDKVNITLASSYPQTFTIGDWIEVFGRVYKLNRLPKVKKDGEYSYTYELEFEGIQYDLLRVMYNVNIDTTNNTIQDVTGDSLTGDLRRFLDVLVANANRVFPGVWSIGDCPSATESDVTKTFGESDNCLAVLQSLCSDFDVEFDISTSDGMHFAINIGKVGDVLPQEFQYGRGGGLYEMTRDNVSSANVITRLYAYGSTENITCKYRGTRLMLPSMAKSESFIDNNVAKQLYGVCEAVKYFDIKPSYEGSVTSVINNDVLSFVDGNFPFDINEKESDGVTTKYLIDGVAAKIHFNSGNLAGFEFEIKSYDHAARKFTLIKQTDERGNVFPSARDGAFYFNPGDKYKILDIAYPNSITCAAEAKLLEEATKYLNENCQPKVQYTVAVAKQWLQRHVSDAGITNYFNPGDYIHIMDEGIGVDKSIRINGIERDILDPYEYKLTISDTVTVQLFNRLISDSIEMGKVIQINDLKNPARARANWMSSREVLAMVFDTEGNYYTDKIAPQSIDTMMLNVGAKSMQFGLVGICIEANYHGNPNSLAISSGYLVHYAIEENPRYWAMQSLQMSNLASSTAYYIYAMVARDGSVGNFTVTPSQIKVDQIGNLWTFLVGVLNSVDTLTNTRTIYTMYGFTTINGRFIRTGRIQSADGETYFDLDLGEIGGKITFTRNDGSTGNVSDVDDIATNAQNYIDNTLPEILGDMAVQIDGKIDTWYQEDDPSTAWATSDDRKKHIGDMWYKSSTNELKRYSATFAWEMITDATAIAAYAAASQAQDTADGKRRVFTAQPTTEDDYDVGDLWVNATIGDYINDILRCKTAKVAGTAFSISHWQKAANYTDNSELHEFIENTYNQTIQELQSQLDGQIEQFFEDVDPVPTSGAWDTSTMNEPFLSWHNALSEDANAIRNHLGDLYYNTSNGKVFRLIEGRYQPRPGAQTAIRQWWSQLQDEELAQALVLAQDAYDLADGKRTIYASQPNPPYDIGDLWVNATVGDYVNDILVCVQERATGNFSVDDWAKASKYTDDTALNNFIGTTFTDVIQTLTTQIDGKIETWFTSSDPSMAWTTDNERNKHVDDIWYNTSAKTLWHYVNYNGTFFWQRITDQKAIDAYDAASAAQDTADGKRRVFTAQPTTEDDYDVGDLWVQGGSGDILVCIVPKTSGTAYSRTHWANASKYTDDTALNNFIANTYTPTIEDITTQIDGKIETWFTSSDPSTAWTTDNERNKHVDDIWYNTSAKTLWHYAKSTLILNNVERVTYNWVRITDKKAIDAYDAASAAQDTADGKRTVFVAQPTASDAYDVGDLWVNCTYNNGGVVYNNDLLRCVTAKTAGAAFSISHWALATAYDNTKTTIDGGVVTSGTIRLAGDDTTIKSGITGNGTADTSIRIWAGATEQNRAIAPFRVNQAGEAWMTNAHVSGEVTATSGAIGGFNIGDGLIGTSASEASSSTGLSLSNEFVHFHGSQGQDAIIGVLNYALGFPYCGKLSLTSGRYDVGTTLILEHKQTDTTTEYLYTRRALDVTGNTFMVGKTAIFDNGYIGQIYSDTLELYFGLTHRFHITANDTDNLAVYLPGKAQVQNIVSTSVIFDIEIVCDNIVSAFKIYPAKNGDGVIYNANFASQSTIAMSRGDSLRLRYYNGHWIITNHNS